LAVLALLAYVPALLSSPGKVPADTKLYLYTNPGRLLGDAPWSWDTRQFAGWVPHQTIGYLWPSGPWYWTFEHLGIPDWIAQRLWIGTILFAAGAGMRWCAKQLGLAGALAPLAAAVVYQMSPYVLPYISRTSVLLLPWAGLGWLVGITVNAGRRGGWRDPALFALVVFTIGGINATAMVMIAPAPILLLADAAARREISVRHALVTTAKLGGLALLVSLWWLVGLAVQGSYGADVLSYSETLQSVSFTSLSSEALRGLGYWLFYVRDPTGALTTASGPYQTSLRLIAIGFVIILVALAGLIVVRWRARRFAALMILTGIVLAVGAHPIDDPSPLGAPLSNSSRSTLTLALRSSTRAVPLALLGLALGVGALVMVLRVRWVVVGRIAAVLVALLAVLNLPSSYQHAFVDPVLERPQDLPSWWKEASTKLDALPPGARVLQLPGTESAVSRWGTTVDPILPGLSDRQLIARDWLPLGSAAAMDLSYALDDRFQDGTIDPDSIAPIARLLGADTVLYTGDVAFDRFRTTRPELSWAVYTAKPKGLGTPQQLGPVQPNEPAVPMLDDRALVDRRIGRPVPQLALIPVEGAQPMVRAATGSVVVVGSGAGLVDAAGAGWINGSELVRYAASETDPDKRAALLDAAGLVVITDTNRKQAHEWRGSQDVLGMTEDEDPATLSDDAADHRLPVFPDQTTDSQTLAMQVGPVHAIASTYGAPDSYRPEDRAVHAIDGDLTTAWRVGDRSEVKGEHLRLDFAERPVQTITLVQPQDPALRRWITGVVIHTDDGDVPVALDERSRTPDGQVIDLGGRRTSKLDIEITATNTGEALMYPYLNGVGFAEAKVDDLAPTEEVVTLPADAARSTNPRTAIVLTRWRVDPTNRWRADPEVALDRSFDVGAAGTYHLSVSGRLDQRADDSALDSLLRLTTAPTATTRVAGSAGSAAWAALDGNPATAWTTGFDQAVGSTITIPLGSTRIVGSLTFQPIDDGRHSVPTELVISAGNESRTVEVPDNEGSPVPLGFTPLTGDELTVRISKVRQETTVDRRYGEVTELPVGVANIAINGVPAVKPAPAVDTGCRNDLLRLDGRPIPVRVTGTTADLLAGKDAKIALCSPAPLALTKGSHHLTAAPGLRTGIDLDQVVLRNVALDRPAPAAAPRPTATLTGSSRTGRMIEVGSCPKGCWVVSGEGWNTGWSASVDGESLGAPTLVDGGMSAWLLPPSDQDRVVQLHWKPQRTIWFGLAISLIAVLACLAVVAMAAYQYAVEPLDPLEGPTFVEPWRRTRRFSWRLTAGLTVASALLAALIIKPIWALPTAAIVFGLAWLRRYGLVAVIGWLGIGAVALLYLQRQHSLNGLPGFGWVVNVEDAHRPTLFALVLITAGLLVDRRVRHRSRE
jgi:arabinofuranan 3-O-arabinosyltransferase